MGSDVDQDRADIDAGDQPALNRGPHGDCEVRLDLAVDGASQALLEQAVNKRSASGPADEHNLVDLGGLQHGVGERVVQAGQGLEEQRLDQLFIFVPSDLHDEVQWFSALLGDEFFLDGRQRVKGQAFLGVFRGAGTRALEVGFSLRSMPCFCLNELQIWSSSNWSKSSPPSCVSPWLAMISTTPFSTCATETSNVPPPRS